MDGAPAASPSSLPSPSRPPRLHTSERLGVGQLADWVLAARAQGGAPPYTPLDGGQADALRGALPNVERARIHVQLEK